MSEKSSKAKGILLPTLLGGVFLFLAAFIVAIGALVNLIPTGTETLEGVTIQYGAKGALFSYLGVWTNQFPHWVAYVTVMLCVLAVLLLIINVIVAFVRKKKAHIVSAILLSIALAGLPYFFILVTPLIKFNLQTQFSLIIVSSGTACCLLAAVLLVGPTAPILFGRKEEVASAKEEPQAKPQPEPTITEKDVRTIASELIHEHVLDRHKSVIMLREVEEPKEEEKEAPKPVEEPKEEKKPEPKPEKHERKPVEEKKPEPVAPSAEEKVFGNGRRRAKFETRLRNSEYDLRHKYYDLRDYIKWYGVNNRISIPGDTFSLHRERYAFITINGKHIKIYLALDPAKYQGSTIPVEAVDSKKYEDLPCMLKVRSDLSYRRAKQLIDDVMAAKGQPKPEGPAPSETQEEN